jgi:hypothetical protein
MYLSIISVVPSEDYKLILTFENSEQREFDANPLLDFGRFSELRDKNVFKSVRISFDTIEWANELDLDPEYLYEKSIPLINKKKTLASV